MRKLIPALLLCALLVSPSHAEELSGKVLEKTLPNGLKVIILENHKAPLFTFQVWYRVGSRNEAWGKTGLSHMLEHMMFKGTKKVSSAEFLKAIEENGGNYNAFTSNDFTAYFETLSKDHILVPMALESDRMENLTLRDKDFLTERMVVMEERRLRTDDNPKAYLEEQMGATAFQVQPYHWPVIGWMEDISRFTVDDLKSYYQTYYKPMNAFLIVIGDFEKKKVLAEIEKTFGPLPPGVPPDQKRDIEPQQPGERRVIAKKEAQLPFVLMGYHVPNIRNQDGYVLEVIAAVLSGGKSSRLYRDLVLDKQLVLEADASNSLLSRDPSLFTLSATPLPGKTSEEVESALDREIDLLQKEPVGERELEKAKNQLEAAFVYSQDSLMAQAMLIARHEIAVGWKAIDEYIPRIREVTPGDILRVAKQYLTKDNRTVGVLAPLPPREGKPAPAGPSPGERMIR